MSFVGASVSKIRYGQTLMNLSGNVDNGTEWNT